MKHMGRGTSTQPLLYLDTPTTERCSCLPLSTLHAVASCEQGRVDVEDESLTPTTQELNSHLRSVLATSFPRETPLSVLLLHISQFEHIKTTSQSTTLYKRLRYHAPTSFLEQVLSNVRRTIRASDQILVHAGIGAAIIFPDVDRHGMAGILERVYQNIRLLQAETAIPPLRRETDILLGIGSYPEPGISLERLLYYTGLI